jgi:glutaredoxin 3
MKAVIYSKTKSVCPYCVKAKALFEKHGIDYEEISVEDNREECFRVVREATGSDPKTAPQIFIDGEYIGGHDQLVEWLAKA